MQPPINIVNVYGKQECRTSKEEIDEDWKEILEILAKIDAIDKSALVIGDMNRMVGNIVKGNHKKSNIWRQTCKRLSKFRKIYTY